jgi:hypothetical protein
VRIVHNVISRGQLCVDSTRADLSNNDAQMEATSNDEMPNLPIFPRCTNLPPELTDAIINLLHADHETLALCALVCRSWVPASRRHLFSDVSISPNDSRVLELLSSTKCTFASSVDGLELTEIEGISNLSGITSRLSGVKRLSLRRSELDDGVSAP